MNPVPLTVIVKSASPEIFVSGEMAVMVGTTLVRILLNVQVVLVLAKTDTALAS